jgi:DNA-binding IclR family transcriptional regulator
VLLLERMVNEMTMSCFLGIDDPSAANQPKRTMLSRALAILCTFEHCGDTLSLTELSRRAHLSKPTTHRLVAELLEWGLLERRGRDLRLGQRLSVLGARVQMHRMLRDTAAPLLARTYECTGCRVYLSVCDGDTAVHLDRVGGHMSHAPGRMCWDEISANAAAKAITAFDRPLRQIEVARETPRLDEASRRITTIRSLGYSVVEHGEGSNRAVAVASPVFASAAGAHAAISVVGPAHEVKVGVVALAVRAAATALTRELDEVADVEWSELTDGAGTSS